MSDNPSGDDTYIRRFGFRRFTGVRQNRLYRIISVAWFNLIEAIRRSGFTKMLLVFMFFSILIQDVLIIVISWFLPFTGPLITINELFRDAYADSVLGMVSLVNRITVLELGFMPFNISAIGISFIWLLLMAIVGGGLIADDRLHQTTEVYFSRISRLEYTIGKLMSLILFSTVVIVLPSIIQYFLLSYGLETDLLVNIDLMLWGVGFTLLAAFLLSLIILALSSFTKRRAVATLSFFIAAIVLSSFYSAIGWAQSESLILLLDFVGAIALLGAMALGYESLDVNGRTIIFSNGIGVEGPMVLAVVLTVLILGIVALMLTLFRRDS
ncbi:MAG: hypothetical protein ACFFEA_04405 [Candidatus Thorarchaeota archaeon]